MKKIEVIEGKKRTNRELLKHPEGSIYSDGYGQIGKVIMRDREISIEAKGIYAYLCSYSGGGDCAYPSRDMICKDLGISINRYYKHFKMLVDGGYLHVARLRSEGNTFENNVYMLEFVVKKRKAKKDEK